MINICNECNNNKNIVIEENRRKLIVLNNANFKINKVRVDGCYITNKLKCDYLLELIDNKDNVHIVFYVELKGSDINHAIKQVESTMRYCRAEHNNLKKECYIILSRFPSAGTSAQILKKKFKKNNKVQLYIDSKVKKVTV